MLKKTSISYRCCCQSPLKCIYSREYFIWKMFSRQEVWNLFCTFSNIYLQNRWNNKCLIKVFVLNVAIQEAIEQINWRLSKMQFSNREDKVERKNGKPGLIFTSTGLRHCNGVKCLEGVANVIYLHRKGLVCFQRSTKQ